MIFEELNLTKEQRFILKEKILSCSIIRTDYYKLKKMNIEELVEYIKANSDKFHKDEINSLEFLKSYNIFEDRYMLSIKVLDFVNDTINDLNRKSFIRNLKQIKNLNQILLFDYLKELIPDYKLSNLKKMIKLRKGKCMKSDLNTYIIIYLNLSKSKEIRDTEREKIRN